MPSALKRTPYHGDKIANRYGGLVKSELVNHLEGRVCYHLLKQGYSCGYEHTFRKGEKYSLTTKVGAEPFTAEVGTEFTMEEEWRHKSGDCELCDPEVCYPDTEIFIWKVRNKIKFWKLGYSKKYTVPKRGRAYVILTVGILKNANVTKFLLRNLLTIHNH